MKTTASFLIALAIGAGFVATANAAGTAKRQICHYSEDTGLYQVIEISVQAVAQHLANHGDTFPGVFYEDVDGDGYGDAAGARDACPNPGFASVDGDCNDEDANVNPGAAEICGDTVDNNCSGTTNEDCVGCVEILLHCDAGSELMQTVCGGGVHNLDAYTAANISYVRFGANVSGVTLIHCADGSSLSSAELDIAGDTNLCGLEGGCCDYEGRWNDTVCQIELY